MSRIYIAEGGRQAIGRLIATHVGENVRLDHDRDGAPLLVGSTLHISISHSRRFAAIMLNEKVRCGIDIEEPRLDQLERVRSKFLTPAELAAEVDLLSAWTAKEAVFKASATPGLGMSMIDTLSTPGLALLPDGRKFHLQTIVTPDYTLTTALPTV
ncbi:MAG: 4'-phosphopantetheinyl transferase superfamily protein [Muribaculaceae bacterium]|nr:4'-phosphopantetheinyl transferase superfamily protein [Muribaculaceae bacterium]